MSLKGAEYIHSPEKRRFDVAGSLAMLGAGTVPFFMPMWAATSIEHRLLNPFFVQKRLGKAGREFDAYKFESLGEHDGEEVSLGGAEHPNASWLGRLVRNAALDELPQLANVLKGDMHLVGIRPITAGHMDVYREMIDDEALFTEWRECYDQNPGLTGKGQLYSKNFPDHDAGVVRQRMEIDIDAFHQASLDNDIQVVRYTPRVLLQAAAAHLSG